MGKAATTEMKRKKKKGRPSLLDLQKRALNQQQSQTVISSSPSFNNTPIRRSTRRNPHLHPDSVSPAPQFSNVNYDDEEEDERKEKKVKLVVRLPQINQHLHNQTPSSAYNSLSCNSNAEDEDHQASLKKRKINAVVDRSDDVVAYQGEKGSKATDTLHGSPLESGPTTPLPDKKLLLFILDRLQKKDTFGVFSEPVDPNELPDYHEIIQHPMDFGTVRQKLHEGLYSNLEELEADVFLLCSNAMQYNAPDTIYFRQARSIQELARRDFDNLKQEGEDGEPQPKVVRRGRPPGKNLKKPLGRPPVVRVGPEFSSDATLASGGDDMIGSNSYNLRRGLMPYKYRSDDGLTTSKWSRNGENYSEWMSDWNDEFPASILRADMKYGKKQFSLDENKRDTYKQFHPPAYGQEASSLTNSLRAMKQLMPVGLQFEHGYTRSVARFAANLGPAVWRVASEKIESVLTPGLKFGPGWVGENEGSPQLPPIAFDMRKSETKLACYGYPDLTGTPLVTGMNSSVAHQDSLPCKLDLAEATMRTDSTVPQSSVAGIRPSPSLQSQQKSLLHPNRNGFNGVLGYDVSTPMGMVRSATPVQDGQQDTSQTGSVAYSCGTMATCPAPRNNIDSEEPVVPDNSNLLQVGKWLSSDTSHSSPKAPVAGMSKKASWHALSPRPREHSLSVPPDLNIQFQSPNSPSSSLQLGSPHQPDLALQL